MRHCDVIALTALLSAAFGVDVAFPDSTCSNTDPWTPPELAARTLLHSTAQDVGCDLWNRRYAADAELIVAGVTGRATTYKRSGLTWTLSSLHVDTVLKGLTAAPFLHIISPGGSLGDTASFIIDFNFPFYDPGDSVLVYLVRDRNTAHYAVAYHYFRLVAGQVMSAHGYRYDPRDPRFGPPISSAQLKAGILGCLACNEPARLALDADAVVLATVDTVSTLSRTLRIQVLDTLRGALPAVVNEIDAPFADVHLFTPRSTVVLFLCSNGSGRRYELLGGSAGVYSLRDGRVTGTMGSYPLDRFRLMVK